MRFILIWSDIVVDIGRHYFEGQMMALRKRNSGRENGNDQRVESKSGILELTRI